MALNSTVGGILHDDAPHGLQNIQFSKRYQCVDSALQRQSIRIQHNPRDVIQMDFARWYAFHTLGRLIWALLVSLPIKALNTIHKSSILVWLGVSNFLTRCHLTLFFHTSVAFLRQGCSKDSATHMGLEF